MLNAVIATKLTGSAEPGPIGEDTDSRVNPTLLERRGLPPDVAHLDA